MFKGFKISLIKDSLLIHVCGISIFRVKWHGSMHTSITCFLIPSSKVVCTENTCLIFAGKSNHVPRVDMITRPGKCLDEYNLIWYNIYDCHARKSIPTGFTNSRSNGTYLSSLEFVKMTCSLEA